MIIDTINGETPWFAFLTFRTNSFARDTNRHRALAPPGPPRHKVGSQAQ